MKNVIGSFIPMSDDGLMFAMLFDDDTSVDSRGRPLSCGDVAPVGPFEVADGAAAAVVVVADVAVAAVMVVVGPVMVGAEVVVDGPPDADGASFRACVIRAWSPLNPAVVGRRAFHTGRT